MHRGAPVIQGIIIFINRKHLKHIFIIWNCYAAAATCPAKEFIS